jgi:hypothetical protein
METGSAEADERFLTALRELCEAHGVTMLGTFGGDTLVFFSDGRELNIDSLSWRATPPSPSTPLSACRPCGSP